MYTNTPHKYVGLFITRLSIFGRSGEYHFCIHCLSSLEQIPKGKFIAMTGKQLGLVGTKGKYRILGSAAKKHRFFTNKSKPVSPQTFNKLFWLGKLDLKYNPYEN